MLEPFRLSANIGPRQNKEALVGNESTFTFIGGDGRRVKATRRANPDGSVGGWVAENAEVHPSAIIDVDAIVEPGAIVGENEHLAAGETRYGEGWTNA